MYESEQADELWPRPSDRADPGRGACGPPGRRTTCGRARPAPVRPPRAGLTPTGASRRPARRAGPGQAGRAAARPRNAIGLTRDEIVDAAIAVADAEGCRRRQHAPDRPGAAGRRNVPVLACGQQGAPDRPDARHADGARSRCPSQAVTGGRTCARSRATSGWCCCDIAGSSISSPAGPPLGPSTLRNLDRTLALLDEPAGMTPAWTSPPPSTCCPREHLRARCGAARVQETRAQRDQERAEADGRLRRQAGRLAGPARGRRPVRPFGRDPRRGCRPDAEGTRDERFEFGLDCLLDGLAARVPALARGARSIAPGLARITAMTQVRRIEIADALSPPTGTSPPSPMASARRT